jgi:hypothetical protein
MAKRGRPRKNPLPEEEAVFSEEVQDEVKDLKEKVVKVKKAKVDSVMESMMNAAEKEFGKKGLFVGSADDIATEGFPLRHLALKWLLVDRHRKQSVSILALSDYHRPKKPRESLYLPLYSRDGRLDVYSQFLCYTG